MLRLDLKREAQWWDMAAGVRLLLEPMTAAVMLSARADPAVAAATGGVGVAMAMAVAVAQRVVVDWEGVGDADGNPVPVTPDGIAALMEIWPIFEAFQGTYAAKAMLLDMEKKGSGHSRNGTTAVARNTARPAPASAKSARKSRTGR